jgi:hypothetical protein
MIYQHILEYQNTENNLKHQNDRASVVEASTAVVSLGTAFLAIRTIVTLSTTTSSAGGFLGLLGATTTVINWPVALLGITVVGSLFVFSGNKAVNLKSKTIMRYKNEIQASIRERIIYNKANDSVCQLHQAKIEEITNSLLSELSI